VRLKKVENSPKKEKKRITAFATCMKRIVVDSEADDTSACLKNTGVRLAVAGLDRAQ
jgi:hypothetical protein